MYSNTKYICLPSKKNPTYLLAVGSKVEKNNSFNLFRAVSIKAKILKYIAIKFPIFNTVTKEKSPFINYLESEMNKNIVSSVYFSSCRHMVVMQLQSDGIILGYLKYALTENGNRKIKNEQYALENLKCIGIPRLINNGSFNQYRYILTESINNNPNLKPINHDSLNLLLKRLTINGAPSYLLREHPRIINLKKSLEKHHGLRKYIHYFDKLVLSDNKLYKVTPEHGDFTPWNIIHDKKKHYLIDFEDFIFEGLEGMDLCHYFFMEQLYIKKNSSSKIIKNTLNSVGLKNKKILYIYLIKTLIMRLNYKFETSDYLSALKIYIEKIQHES